MTSSSSVRREAYVVYNLQLCSLSQIISSKRVRGEDSNRDETSKRFVQCRPEEGVGMPVDGEKNRVRYKAMYM